MSAVFPKWKGVRCDFRLAADDDTPVFVLAPKRSFVRVEIRKDATHYRDRKGRLARSTGFSPRELRGIQRVVAENETALQEAWNEYFAD